MCSYWKIVNIGAPRSLIILLHHQAQGFIPYTLHHSEYCNLPAEFRAAAIRNCLWLLLLPVGDSERLHVDRRPLRVRKRSLTFLASSSSSRFFCRSSSESCISGSSSFTRFITWPSLSVTHTHTNDLDHLFLEHCAKRNESQHHHPQSLAFVFPK